MLHIHRLTHTVDPTSLALLLECSASDLDERLDEVLDEVGVVPRVQLVARVVDRLRSLCPQVEWQTRTLSAVACEASGQPAYRLELRYPATDPGWLLEYLGDSSVDVRCPSARDALLVTAVVPAGGDVLVTRYADAIEAALKNRLADLMRELDHYHAALPYVVGQWVVCAESCDAVGPSPFR